MNKKLYQTQNIKNVGLKILQQIKKNQYRSKDNSQCYCPFAVEQRIIELQEKQAEKLVFEYSFSNEEIFFPPRLRELKDLILEFFNSKKLNDFSTYFSTENNDMSFLFKLKPFKIALNQFKIKASPLCGLDFS